MRVIFRPRLPPLVHLLLLGGLSLLAALPAAAQEEGPPGPFAVDVRGSLARYGQDLALASNLGVHPTDLPARGLGIDVGAHWYFFRWRPITFGIGTSVLVSRGEQASSSAGQTSDGQDVRTTFSAFAPQLSFNFGTSRGWSYISGGIATSRFHATRDTGADEPDRRARTINYGGGARWFAKPHLAFAIDARFYAISPQAAEGAGVPATPRMTLMVVSVGVSVK